MVHVHRGTDPAFLLFSAAEPKASGFRRPSIVANLDHGIRQLRILQFVDLGPLPAPAG